MDKKEAVRLISQALSNLRVDYPFKDETWQAFGFLGIKKLAESGYQLITKAPDIQEGIVIQYWEDKPFVRVNPTEMGRIFETHIGEINTSYNELCRVFGRHDQWHDTYKQDASWHIEFQNGTYASIGNFKDGHNYLGKKGRNLVDIKRWDVWGDKNAIQLIKKQINESR